MLSFSEISLRDDTPQAAEDQEESVASEFTAVAKFTDGDKELDMTCEDVQKCLDEQFYFDVPRKELQKAYDEFSQFNL